MTFDELRAAYLAMTDHYNACDVCGYNLCGPPDAVLECVAYQLLYIAFDSLMADLCGVGKRHPVLVVTVTSRNKVGG